MTAPLMWYLPYLTLPKNSKKQYYAEYFATNVNNIKKTWDGIRRIVNMKRTSAKTSQLNIGGKIIVDDKDLARNDSFSQFNSIYFTGTIHKT